MPVGPDRARICDGVRGLKHERVKFISGLYMRQTINTKQLEIQPKFIN